MKLALFDLEAGPGGVDRHPHFAAEPGGERKAASARCCRESPLARERLAGLEPRKRADQSAAGLLGDAEATALLLGEDGDRQIRSRLGQRAQVAAQVCVAEEQPPRRRFRFAQSQRLTLAEARKPHDAGAGPLRLLGSPVT